MLPSIHDLVDHARLRFRRPRKVLSCCGGELVRPAHGTLGCSDLIENFRQMAFID